LINELQRESARSLHWPCTTTVRDILTGVESGAGAVI
jgi:hypothetical protein